MDLIPRSFDDWKNCIINDCKIDLNPDFARERLNVYENENHSETIKFRELYGEKHLDNIIYWYKLILK